MRSDNHMLTRQSFPAHSTGKVNRLSAIIKAIDSRTNQGIRNEHTFRFIGVPVTNDMKSLGTIRNPDTTQDMINDLLLWYARHFLSREFWSVQ